MLLKLNNLKISVKRIAPETVAIDKKLAPFIAKQLNVSEKQIAEYIILNKSIDSRKGVPDLIYNLAVRLHTPPKMAPHDKQLLTEDELGQLLKPELELPTLPPGLKNPLVVGTGPAGIMAGYVLALAGSEPVIIDRGRKVERRSEDIEKFHSSRELDPDSNYLIGEGGAGTFSDGKLYTRTRDSRAGFVLNTFVEAGAPPEIMYLKRPHIGSDILQIMVARLRHRIEELGGTFKFETEITDVIESNGICKGVITSNGEKLEAPAVIIAHGLGGRELTANLLKSGLESKLKGFQIGCRIEHPQELIDHNQYRLRRRPAFLGAAEYNLTSRPPETSGLAGVSSFCMCPGGEIVASTAYPNRLSTNGMSKYARNGKFANSCLIVNQPSEFFENSHAAYEFLKQLEQETFALGGADYTAPAQDAAAFIRGEKTLSTSETSYRFGLKPARLDKILPPRTRDALREALRYFDRHFHGFTKNGKLVGIETFVSSPIRFERNPETLESSLKRLYIAGEGAGYAGGIMSAAIDGIKTAEKILAENY
jgi:uncharacterized FAD-dependent dehydrogenase